ncbi:hypothetical protein Pelo_2811 [Pelomyxa schiedti]|nr:hypothetical protein Pelo_2811 [Pelomyxa schiedti]
MRLALWARVAVFGCSLFFVAAQNEVFPQVTYTKEFYWQDPFGFASCILSGEDGFTQGTEHLEYTAVSNCDVSGVIQLVNSPNWGLLFGSSSSPIASYSCIGTISSLREQLLIDDSVSDATIYTSIKYSEKSDDIQIITHITDGTPTWSPVNKSSISGLYIQNDLGNSIPVNVDIGSIYLVRISSNPVDETQLLSTNTLVIFKLLPAATMAPQGLSLRWSILYSLTAIPDTPDEQMAEAAARADGISIAALIFTLVDISVISGIAGTVLFKHIKKARSQST